MLFGKSAPFVGRGYMVTWEERIMKGRLLRRCEGILVKDIPAGHGAGSFPFRLRGGYAQFSYEDRVVVKSRDGKKIVFTPASRGRRL